MSKSSNKERVLAFRITDSHASKLEREMSAVQVVGVRSTHQLARKLVMDFLEGRLVYSNPVDRNRDPAMNLTVVAQPALGRLKAA